MKKHTMLRGLLTGLLLCCSIPSFAIYKCEAGGKVSYSDVECSGGKTVDVSITSSANSSEDSKRALQEKHQLEQLQNARHKREAKEDKERQQAAKAGASKQKKCATLERRQKWADEDAMAAKGKTRDAARRKARRIAEEHLAECGAPNQLGMAH
ncbi:MAG TPA: hypothetical protein VJ654_17190 [Noviherbaspirillum sp.]|nr:hypothetical protein [Noviherbaspirillum sp.]